MQVDALTVRLRPRPMFEAADLGVRLVQVHAGALWRSCWPVFALLLGVSLLSLTWASWAPCCVLFCLKPWLDRSILFVLSRALFGQDSRFADLWSARRSLWFGQWWTTLTRARLSPWRSYTAPVLQLEGQGGAALRERRRQLLAGQQGSASMLQFVFAQVEAVLYLGCFGLVEMLMPGDQTLDLWSWLTHGSGVWPPLCLLLGYGVAVAFLEPFFVATGFAMYLNRRVELEAWDIEQEFRRVFP